MKKLIFIVGLLIVGTSSHAQFPTTDSLVKFINKYIRNSAVEAFQNLRLNTALIGMTRFVDSAHGGQVKTFSALNDSTIRLVTLGNDTFDVVIRGNGITNFITSAQQDTLLRYLPMVGWGDSYMEGHPAYPFLAQVSRLTGRYAANRGTSGQTSPQILTRFLAEPSKYTWPTIIESGSNNALDTLVVLANIAQMVDSLESRGNNKYIVMGMAIGDFSNQYIGTPNYNTKKWLNDSLAVLYGPRFLPLTPFLISCNNGSPGDLIDVANGVIPRSLRHDQVHLNKTGYDTLAWFIVNGFNKYLSADTLNKPVPEQFVYNLFNGKAPATFTESLWVRDSTAGDVFHVDAEKKIVEKFGQIRYTDTTANLLTNGDFSGGLTGWTSGGNWTAATLKATHNTGNTTSLSQNVAITPSRMFMVEFTVSDRTTGSVTAFLGANELNSGLNTITNAITTNGSYRCNFYAGTTTTVTLSFTPTSDFNGSISAVKYKYFADNNYYNESSTTDTTYNTRLFNGSIGIGYRPFNYMTAFGALNTAFGYRAGDRLSNGAQNVYVGADAGYQNDDGSYNTAIGYSALSSSTSSIRSTALGFTAGMNSDRGYQNTYVGAAAGLFPTALSSNNTFVGAQAGQGAVGAVNVLTNTIVGQGAGVNIATNAMENVIIGANAADNVNGGRRNLVLGYGGDLPIAGGNFQLVIGNAIYGTGVSGFGSAISQANIGIGIKAPARTFHVKDSSNVANTVRYGQRLSGSTSSTAANGYGVGQEFELENASGTNRIAGTFEVPWTDATNASEDADYVVRLIRAGTLTEGFRINSAGQIVTGEWRATTLAIDKGGTNATTANAAFNNLAPDQSGNAGEVLTTDGTNTSWGHDPFPYQLTYVAAGSTSNAISQDIQNITIPDNSTGWIKVEMTGNGIATGSTHNLKGIKYYSYEKIAGTLTLDAADVIVADKKGASVASASWAITTSANNAVVEVTGVSSVTIQWRAAVQVTVNTVTP